MKFARIEFIKLLLLALILAFAQTTKTVAHEISEDKLVELTHVLGPGAPNFHAGEAFHYKKLFSVEKDGYSNGEFTTIEHYGTHVDAPVHFFLGKQSIDQIPLKELVVPCFVIDVRDEVKQNPDYRLTLDKVKSFEKEGIIASHAVVLLLTGWDQRWSQPGKYRNTNAKDVMHFPGFGEEAVDYLVNKRQVAGLGIDTLSADPGDDDKYSTHKIALGQGRYLLENLDNLASVPPRGATLVTAPLRIQNGTGSPARIFAILP